MVHYDSSDNGGRVRAPTNTQLFKLLWMQNKANALLVRVENAMLLFLSLSVIAMMLDYVLTFYAAAFATGLFFFFHTKIDAEIKKMDRDVLRGGF